MCGCKGHVNGHVVTPRHPEDPWVGWQERSSHPNSRTGGGGHGGFRDARPVGLARQSVGKSPPNSPVGLRHGEGLGLGSPTPFRQSDAEPLQRQEPNPPPGTNARTENVLVRDNESESINVKFQVFADRTSNEIHPQGARTTFGRTGVTYTFPEFDLDKDNVITKIKTKFRLRGTIPIRTEYGTQTSATGLACYGRGTTPDDRNNGDITLGFHESCHQANFVAYLNDNDLPTFSIAVGDSKQDYDEAVTQFKQALTDFYDAMKTDSFDKTDNVGYTLSQLEETGECYLHS